MQQEVGFFELFQSGAEGRDEIARQIADESHRVGDHHLVSGLASFSVSVRRGPVPPEAQPARGGIERGEEDVLRQHRGVGQRIEQRALSGVRVADDRDDGDARAAALPAPRRAVGAQPIDAIFQMGDAIAHPAAIDLELRLARSAAADAAGQPREGLVPAHQARQEVLELGQFDLQLAVGAARALREDV